MPGEVWLVTMLALILDIFLFGDHQMKTGKISMQKPNKMCRQCFRVTEISKIVCLPLGGIITRVLTRQNVDEGLLTTHDGQKVIPKLTMNTFCSGEGIKNLWF